MFIGGGRFFFFLAQHTHAAMHISRPKARTPINTPARMTPTCTDPLLLLLPLLLRLLLSESPPLRFGAGCDGESLDGAAGGEPLAAGAGGGNALLFCGDAGGGDSDGVGGDGDGGGEPEPEPEPEGLGDELEGGGDDVSSSAGAGNPNPSSGVAMINV